MKRLLVTGEGYSSQHFQRLSGAGYELIVRPTLEAGELDELILNLDAYLLGGIERLGAETLARAHRLRLISFVGTGYGAFIDEPTARSLGIIIRNTPGVMAGAVAEHTVGLLLGLARGLFSQNESAKRTRQITAPTAEVSGMLVGIVGLGAVGTHVARMLRQAFGCRVAYFSRSRKTNLEEALGLQYYELEALIERVDALVLLLPSSPETRGLIDATMLCRARDGLLLVNTADAHLVDPIALKEALLNGKVRSAAFDGYWTEPLPSSLADPFEFLTLPDDSFVVTPHLAARTESAWPRMVELAVDNILYETMGGVSE